MVTKITWVDDLSTDCEGAEGYRQASRGPHIYRAGEGGHRAVRGLGREAGQHGVAGSCEAKPREGRAGLHWEHRLRNGWLVCAVLGQGFVRRAWSCAGAASCGGGGDADSGLLAPQGR